ncbi:MAG: ABC transporter permease [Lentimicrobium sp.]|jgi:putative ABC transport system permease protein|nr:ABC transporter permease [Lentimicrobium sp.]MDD2528628.1 ABC transporter permease [Lentimicrobiaceae bacterium]MDD4597763.1 ABC transporter permease [Lentimicrobiaceae bacterium]MDY0025857.1 ABC transporter permease [Lentimicrobium sp.]
MFDLDRWQEIMSTLKKNKLRTFFTAFGVFWGIFMLVIMLGSGTGLKNGVTSDFGDFATNSVFMWSRTTTMPYKGFPRGRRFNFRNDDIAVLKREIPEIDILSPRNQGGGRREGNNVIRGYKSGAFSVMGDYPEWNLIDPVNILNGRFLNHADITEKRKVAVIGNKVHEVLFRPGEDAIGQYIQIQGIFFQVIGVFKPGQSGVGFGGDKEQTIFIPLTTFQRIYNWGDIIGWFAFTSKPGVPASLVEEKAAALLKRRHSVSPQDTQALGSFNLEKEYNQMNGLFQGINGLIWVVGIGTLLAGVIGISNIMLVIVKERTKEIGIQRAIGANPWNIISQIMTESVFLTVFAGYVGLVIGVGILEVVNNLLSATGESSNMFKNPNIDFNMAITALAILVFSGAVAGLIPARKAVSIKPIDALRYE